MISFETLENQELTFSPFDFNDNFDTPLHDFDPDIQFYNKHYSGSLQECDYYLENMFNEKIEKRIISNQSFSVLHLNIRSKQKNLRSQENYLEALDHKFTAIGISESWLKEYNVDRHVLDGYKAVHKYRPLRSGGGVSILSRMHCNTSLGKTCVTKINRLNLFSSKLTKPNWERIIMSSLGWFIALPIVTSI